MAYVPEMEDPVLAGGDARQHLPLTILNIPHRIIHCSSGISRSMRDVAGVLRPGELFS